MMSVLRNIRLSFVLYILTVVSVIFYVWYRHLFDIDLKIAFYGFTPYEWLVVRKNGGILTNGFPTGIENYVGSLFMYIYILGGEILQIAPIILTKSVILIELVAVYAASVVLVNLFGKDEDKYQNRLAALIVFLLISVSYSQTHNLARFGNPYFEGYYYNISDALRIAGIVFFIKKRFVISSVLMSLCFMTHPVYGVIGIFFLLAVFVYNIKDYTREDYKNMAATSVIYAICCVGWYIHITPHNIVQMSNNDWFFWAKLGNYHWFPVSYGICSVLYQERLLGFLAVLQLFLFFVINDRKDRVSVQVFYGNATMLFLTAIGVFFSYYSTNQLLVKLSFVRASSLFLWIAIAYIAVRLIRMALDGEENVVIRAFSTILLGATFYYKTGLPMATVSLFLLICAYVYGFKKKLSKITVFYVLMALLPLALCLLYYLKGYSDVDTFYVLTGGKELAISIAVSVVVIAVCRKIGMEKQLLPVVLLLLALGGSYFWMGHNLFIKEKIRVQAVAYKEVQDWARVNTEKDALFMVDPTIYYGWRAYSERASFGSIREWLHVSWLYSSNNHIFEEGLKRFREFGIDEHSDRYKMQIRMKQWHLLSDDVEKTFYAADTEWFYRLSKKYGLDYLVMTKLKIQTEPAYDKVYENDVYVVYKMH